MIPTIDLTNNKLRHSLETEWTPRVTHTAQPFRQIRDLVPTVPLPNPYKQPMYALCNCLISISCTTWRWSLSNAETCSCTLCRKYFTFYQ